MRQQYMGHNTDASQLSTTHHLKRSSTPVCSVRCVSACTQFRAGVGSACAGDSLPRSSGCLATMPQCTQRLVSHPAVTNKHGKYSPPWAVPGQVPSAQLPPAPRPSLSQPDASTTAHAITSHHCSCPPPAHHSSGHNSLQLQRPCSCHGLLAVHLGHARHPPALDVGGQPAGDGPGAKLCHAIAAGAGAGGAGDAG